MKKTMKGPATVDEYMEALPEKERSVLGNLRNTIKATAPKAEEVIRYGMPAFKHNGPLVYFAAFKNHCSLFPAGFMLGKTEKNWSHTKHQRGTLQFTIENPIYTR